MIEIAPRAYRPHHVHVTAVLRHAPGEAGAIAEQFARALAGDGTASSDGQLETRGRRARRPRRRHRRRARAPVAGRVGRRRSCRPRPRSRRCPNVKFLSALRRGNVRGALDLGLTPGFLPGRVTLDAGRDGYAAAWGACPTRPGSTPPASSPPRPPAPIDTLVLLGADPIADFPDRTLRARAALDTVRFVVAVGAFAADAAEHADVFLPVSVWGEKEGSTTNLEGRVLRLARLGHARRHRRWPTGASPPSSRCASASTSASRPSKRCRTRSRASRPRSPASTPRSSGAPATARCCRSAESPTRSCSTRRRASPPASRGSRSRSPRPHCRPDGRRDATRCQPDRSGSTAAGRGRRRRGDRGTPALHVWDRRHGTGARHRRVQSPPRGRPHALRRRTHRGIGPVARRPRAAAPCSSCTRATSAASASPPRATTCASPAPRGTVTLAGAHRRRHRARHRVHGVRPARRRRSQRPRRPHRRRSPTCAWRPHGDPGSGASSTDPLFDGGVDTTVVLIVIGKTIVVFVAAAARRC